MWLTDLEGIAGTILRTVLIGGAAGGLLYLVFWFFIRKKEQLPLRSHLLRWLFSAYLVSLVLLTLVPSGHEADINLIPFRSLAFAVLAVIPVFFCTVAIVNSAKEFDDVFHFNVMIPDMELSLHVEGEYPEKAWVYQMTEDISPEERFRELAEKFDIEEAARAEREYLQAESEGRELLVSKEDAGFWRFSLRSASLAPARQDDAELTEAARNWLQSHGLWKEIFTVRRIEKEYSFSGTGEKDFYSSIDENGKETIAEGWFESGKCVVFEIAYMAAQESGTVAMHFDGDGLYQIEFSTSQYAPYKEVNLLPPKEAFSRFLLSAKCFVAEDLPLYLYNTACFDSAQLVYFPGNGGVKLPSWKLEGAFSMAGGSDEDSVRGAIYISAVA